MLEKKNGTSLSEQLFDILKDLIIKGEYKTGAPFFTEQELEKKYSVSRTTIRDATSRLVHEGLLSRIQGKGTFVKATRIHERSDKLLPFSEEIINRGMKSSAKFIDMKLFIASWKLRNILQLNLSEDKVISLTRVRYADNEPTAIQTTFYPFSLCFEMYEGNFDWNVQAITPILDNLGLRIVRANQRVFASTANAQQASLLNINEKDPILCIERVCFLKDERPIEYAEIYNRGDRWDITMELKREMSKI